ncbi:MAG: hypothetical protein QG621_414 [Patescibacteria group bacterium]|jgi:hypothetical protein|nr:hypothetical protein [Patescibacteria group bacterium]
MNTDVVRQTVDLGFGRAELENYLVACGFWADARRRTRHQYVLSPSAYALSAAQVAQMERLARSTHAAVVALNQHLCECAAASHPSREQARMLRLASGASRGLLRPQDTLGIPPVFKVDLVQDGLGHFHIVEVDVYNPRGYGYAVLLEKSIANVPGVRRLPGVQLLAKIVKQHTRSDPFWVLVPQYERYYEVHFEILCSALRDFGIDARVVREQELSGISPGLVGTLLSIPDSLTSAQLRDTLLAQYRSGELTALYPPVAYLGSKAYLPFLRAQEGMDECIPETELVGRKHHEWRRMLEDGSPCVLKAAVSSGMKGVFFSDTDQAFAQNINEVGAFNHAAWILQQQVPQQPTQVVVFNEAGERHVGDYYLRLVAYVTQEGVLDVEVTGRPDRKVHGAPDCIQLPVILS